MRARISGLFACSSGLALALTAALPAGAAWGQAVQEASPQPQAPVAQSPGGTAAPPPATAPGAVPAPPIAAAPPPAGTTVQEVVITGSHLVRNSFNAPTPVQVLDSQNMQNLGINNVGDALNQLPSFRPSSTPASNLFQVRDSIAAQTMDLRGLGPTRTLTLVNGLRFTPSGDLGTVDLNAIPSLMVARTEVVTGGASAAYGADAVAGVVNVILDDKLQGLKLDASYSQSRYNDNKTPYVGMAGGTSFLGGRGHTIFGAEYYSDEGVGDISSRPWSSRNVNYVANPGFPGNGQPSTLVASNVVWTITRGGVITSGPLAGTQFNAAGQPEPFKFGNPVSGTFMVGGDPNAGAYLIGNVPLVTPNRHISLYSHTDFDITSRITGTFDLSYAYTRGGPAEGADPYNFGVPIQIDNAYLPAATRAAMVAAGVTSIPVSRVSSEFGPQEVAVSTNKTYRFVFGLKGELIGDWKWDASYVWGQTDGGVNIGASVVGARLLAAADAVRAPNGQIVCRSTLTSPNNGCIPFSFFGVPNSTPAAASYVDQTAWQQRTYGQQQLAVNFHGPLFSTWAGPVTAAVGAEYRKDTWVGTADPLSVAGAFVQNYATPLPAGGQDVTEAYVEANLPLMKDMPFGKSLEIDGAGRYTDYSQIGSAYTWKVGAVYRPDTQFLFRVTASKDIRSPTAAELSPVQSLTNLPLLDPVTKGTYAINVVTSGNPDLKLEQATTYTAGGVFQPDFVRNFSLSIDFYDIKINDAIDVLAPQLTINLCAQGNAAICNFVTRGSNGQITQVTSAYQNLSNLSTSGWELVGNYGFRVGDLWAPLGDGRLSLNVNANYVYHLTELNATGQSTEYSDWTGNPGSAQNLLGVPKWRANAVVTYSKDPYSFTVEYRYIPRSLLDPTKIGPGEAGYSPSLPNSINTNYVDSRYYIDLSARYQLGDFPFGKMEIYGTITNVMDTDPPPTLRLFGNPLYYDPVGRAFKIGMRDRW